MKTNPPSPIGHKQTQLYLHIAFFLFIYSSYLGSRRGRRRRKKINKIGWWYRMVVEESERDRHKNRNRNRNGKGELGDGGV